MTDLDLLYSDIEQDLRASLRALLADRCPPSAVAGCYDDGGGPTEALWKSLTHELGIAGLLVPEERGGAGASAREVAVALEELGRAVAPVPFLTSSVVATTALTYAASLTTPDPVALETLAAAAEGELVLTLALPLSLGAGAPLPALSVDESGAVTGAVRSVAGITGATRLLVPVQTAAGVALVAVEAEHVAISPVVSLDMSRPLADLEFSGAPSRPILAAPHGEAALERALVVGAALLASEQLGIARWCLDTTVAYVKERRQFGRQIGSFQALKHRLADLFAAVETAEATARYAAATVAAGDPDATIAASVAQAFCGDLAVRAAEEAIQLHGGIGMTWEHPLHLFLKRAKADQAALGGSAFHRERLAGLVDLPVN